MIQVTTTTTACFTHMPISLIISLIVNISAISFSILVASLKHATKHPMWALVWELCASLGFFGHTLILVSFILRDRNFTNQYEFVVLTISFLIACFLFLSVHFTCIWLSQKTGKLLGNNFIKNIIDRL